ncbi:MAG TPA: OmpA family protein, partial [Thermoanaerobaculia bacterium]|nr:OmpA family protein [Thermoanaerobaculia bacterium]
LAVLLAACSPDEKPVPQSGPAPSAALPQATGTAAAAAMTFEDPEPPDAQARAEAVVNAPFNRDKRTTLRMAMTTIVGRTSKLEGFATGVAAREEKIDDTLARLNARVTETEVVIQLPGAILFDFDSANIRPDAERALNDVATVIKGYPQRPVRVDGHTDSIATDEYNQSLSQRRASSVVAWLTSHGIERARLASAGFGESKPVATNDTAAGRQLNRRVEVVIAKK